MTWWRTTLIVSTGILLAVTLLAGVLFASFNRASDQETLRAAVNNDVLFTGYYEKTYPCGTLGCVKHQPDEGIGAVFLSATGHKLFSTWSLESVIIILALLIAIQFLATTWHARLLTVSIAFLTTGLGLITLAFKSIIITFIPTSVQAYVAPGFNLAFAALPWWYGTTLLIGILLLPFAIIIKKHEAPYENQRSPL